MHNLQAHTWLVTSVPQVVFGQKSGQRLPPAGPGGIQIRTLEEVRAAGEQHPTPHVPPTPDATATLCYTSGTTGVPKGAVLRHSAMVANAVGTMFAFPLNTGVLAHSPARHSRLKRVLLLTADLLLKGLSCWCTGSWRQPAIAAYHGDRCCVIGLPLEARA